MAANSAYASVIAAYTAGTDPPSLSDWFGESFMTPSTGGPWNTITFNFLTGDPGTTPVAAGTAYLLSSEYLGLPGNLSSSTPGFIAASTSVSSGVYLFSTGVTLSQNTEYWVYEDTPLNITGTSVGAGTATQHAYLSFTSTQNFSSFPGAVSNFSVSGTQTTAGAPEPGTAGLGGAALALLACVARRKRQSRAA
jgi:hypothetical protein